MSSLTDTTEIYDGTRRWHLNTSTEKEKREHEDNNRMKQFHLPDPLLNKRQFFVALPSRSG